MTRLSEANSTEREAAEVPIFRALWAMGSYALKRPAIFGALAYFYVSTIGLLYNAIYFSVFDIDVLAFYDVGDFLLAGLRRPLVLLVPISLLAAALLAGVASLVASRLHQRFGRRLAGTLSSNGQYTRMANLVQRYHDFNERWDRRTQVVDRNMIPLSVAIAMGLSALIVPTLAFQDAIKAAGRESEYCVYTEESGAGKIDRANYIGSTQALLFFANGARLHVIPRGRVERIIRAPIFEGRCDLIDILSHPPSPSPRP